MKNKNHKNLTDIDYNKIAEKMSKVKVGLGDLNSINEEEDFVSSFIDKEPDSRNVNPLNKVNSINKKIFNKEIF